MKELDWSFGTVCEEKVRNTTKKGKIEKSRIEASETQRCEKSGKDGAFYRWLEGSQSFEFDSFCSGNQDFAQVKLIELVGSLLR